MIVEPCGYKRFGILFWLDGFDENAMVLVKPLWDLHDYFMSLCAFVIVLYDIFKYNLIGVVLIYNFNFRK
jgi:hypothetical protein